MRCEHCGRDLPADAKFCRVCGAPPEPMRAPEGATTDDADGSGRGAAPDGRDAAEPGPAAATDGRCDAAGSAPDGATDEHEIIEPEADAVADDTAEKGPADEAAPGEGDGAPFSAGFSVIEGGAGAQGTSVPAEAQTTARLASAAPRTVVAGETTRLGEDADGPDAWDDGEDAGAPDAWDEAGPWDGPSGSGDVQDTARQPRPAEPVPRHVAEPSGTDSGRLGLLTAVAVFVAALALLVAFVTWRMELWGGVTLPDVVGMPAQQAEQRLQEAGFQTATNEVVSDDAVGHVVSQSPDPGRREEPGTVVALGVGVERRVPQVVGQPLEQAREALDRVQIAHLRLEYENSDEEEGTVISVSPAEGTVVTADDMVTLVVAQPYTVPDVEGLSLADAQAAIEKSGLTAKTVYVASDKPQGTVVSTAPVAGTTLKEGETVTLNVSSPYPTSLYHVAEYLSTKPEDLSTYLRDKGYRLAYGASENGAATMVWEGAPASPVVQIGPNPFKDYGGFQFWATDALAAGAEVKGVRLQMTQASAPEGVTLKVDQACVSALMNACGLTSSAETTTTAVPSTLVPSVTDAPDFVAKAGTQGNVSWAVAVWEDARGDLVADVCVAPGDSLREALAADGTELSRYGNSLANLAATEWCVEGR